MTAVRYGEVAMRTRWICAALATVLLAACAASGSPTGIATNPPVPGGATGSGKASSSAGPATGARTVLSPLGLNIRQSASVSSTRLGTAAQGAVLQVTGHTDQNGGWYQVQGQTVSGWVTADPTLTAAGQFSQYSSQDRQFSALYPQSWTFAESAANVVFHPTAGDQTIVGRNAVQAADFGASGAAGFNATGQETVIVCGVTANLNEYTHSGAIPPSPAPGTPGPLALLAQIRLRLDATHALALDFNYNTAADLDVFSAFYNSMTFPFPECQLPAPASPSPT
ncbi:MAG: SH3 domain-containing protein [Candidatus Dormibacteraeota bacterium]|nr:SH3 domain-containing protein [Candidatus Dormibacteraeota bacterium]